MEAKATNEQFIYSLGVIFGSYYFNISIAFEAKKDLKTLKSFIVLQESSLLDVPDILCVVKLQFTATSEQFLFTCHNFRTKVYNS